MRHRIVLATVGSLGDLHPFMALGLALRKHDLEVVVAGAADYRDKVERAGLAFHAVRPSIAQLERELGMDRAALARAVMARNDFLFRKMVTPFVLESYEDMRPLVPSADLMLTSSLAFGARLAAEECAVPWLGVVLQPFMFLSAHDAPVIPKAEWLSALLRRLGPVPTAWAFGLLKRASGGMLAPIHAARRRVGLAPARLNPLFEGQFGGAGAIGLYSRLLGEVREDFPNPTAIVGFAPYDSEDGAARALAADLDAFLEAGPAPIVFTLGSVAVNSPGAFYRSSVAAARTLGKRAVLLVGEEAQAEYRPLESCDVHVGDYAPYSLLFPRAQLIVHQGGIGTLAQALRAGRPQLLVPHFADQPDNASRAVRLGVARALAPHRYDAKSAARELGALIADRDVAARALAVRDELLREDGAAAAARVVLETLHAAGVQGRRKIV